MSVVGREQQAGFSALAKCCGTAFGKEGSQPTLAALARPAQKKGAFVSLAKSTVLGTCSVRAHNL